MIIARECEYDHTSSEQYRTVDTLGCNHEENDNKANTAAMSQEFQNCKHGKGSTYFCILLVQVVPE